METALRRELIEELGATVSDVSQVLLMSTPSESGVAVQHFFVARLLALDEAARTGPEFEIPLEETTSWTGYLHADRLASMDLQPVMSRDYIRRAAKPC